MATIIKNMNDLKKQIDNACNKAVENAANILLKKLQEYINEDYYDLYQPIYYSRTMKFYESAVAIKCIWLTQATMVILIFIEMVTFGKTLKSMQMRTPLIF